MIDTASLAFVVFLSILYQSIPADPVPGGRSLLLPEPAGALLEVSQ